MAPPLAQRKASCGRLSEGAPAQTVAASTAAAMLFAWLASTPTTVLDLLGQYSLLLHLSLWRKSLVNLALGHRVNPVCPLAFSVDLMRSLQRDAAF